MEWEDSDWEQERNWQRWCGPPKKGRQSWQAPMEMAQKINPRGLNCPKSSVGGCFLFGWKLVNTYCKLDCRPIQLLPIILYQNNYIWGCPVNYFDLDLPEVWLTLCVYSRSTNKKKPSPTQGLRKATKGLMWWNQHHILTTTHSNDWLI